ncbi:MAG: sigma-70 family RNA polymerase sigma factor [Thermomicrobiales bacterium]|nr:sigma-70 family RNA polymerase sigma factor [Thermomicrobiales bacterium]MCO5225100.1 sigma-70 family RNA polymerase sigma factor [Thermomicrobiales bacterium]
MHVTKPHHQLQMSEPELRIVDEEMLIEHARHDPDAFAVIYERYADPVYRMCLRAAGDPDVADDLTATVFLKAFERLDNYHPRPDSTFRAWLFAVARNALLDYWRRNRRVISWGEEEIVIVDQAPGPEEIALSRISLAEVRTVLATLNNRHRSIVEFRLSGLTTQEIASALDMSIPALKSAQTRAYASIRKHLAPKGATL